MKDTCLDASVKQLLRNYNLSVQSGNDKLFLCSFIFTSLTFYLAGSKQVEAKTVGAKKTCFGEQLPTHQFLTKWLLKVTEEFDWDHGTFPYRALVRHRTCCKTSSSTTVTQISFWDAGGGFPLLCSFLALLIQPLLLGRL